jgi:alpha-tubulin suppressor-like RCC1 family protein
MWLIRNILLIMMLFVLGVVSPASAADNDEVYTWGVDKADPASVNGIQNVADVAAGCSHTLVVKSDRTVYAWGDNSSRQLGTGGTTDSLVPVRSGSLVGIVTVAAGAKHSLALTAGGRVYAWGNNTVKELGRNTDGTPSPVPTDVGLSDIVAISAGESFSLALSASGQVYSWGCNTYNQLGRKDDPDNLIKSISIPADFEGVIAISAGGTHAVALTADGKIWGWGNNQQNQLGTIAGTPQPIATPTQLDFPGSYRAIAAGYDFSLALDSEGKLWSVGNNGNKQLGRTDHTTLPMVYDPTGTTVFKAISAGKKRAAAVDGSGNVYAWGQIDSQKDNLTPTVLTTIKGAQKVACGGDFTVAMIATDKVTTTPSNYIVAPGGNSNSNSGSSSQNTTQTGSAYIYNGFTSGTFVTVP